MDIESLKPVLQNNHWFTSLPSEVIAQLVDLCKVKKLQVGEVLHAKGDDGEGLYCVLSGKLKVSNFSSEGKESVLTWLSPGSWAGEISLFDNLPRTHHVEAEKESEILLLPTTKFHHLLEKNPHLYPHFMRLLCERIRIIFSLLDDASFLPLKGQLAKRLLILSDSFGGHNLGTEERLIEISQESLALMLHTSRQTINKLLQQLQDESMIELQYGVIRIIDHEALISLCDN